MNKCALFIIKLYQRHISPRKGYCCAYGSLYNDGSCSERVSLIIKDHGVLNGWAQIKHQFEMCSEAYEEIKEKNKNKEKNKKDKNEWCNSFDACEVFSCIPFPRRWCRGNPTDSDCDLPCDCSLF